MSDQAKNLNPALNTPLPVVKPRQVSLNLVEGGQDQRRGTDSPLRDSRPSLSPQESEVQRRSTSIITDPYQGMEGMLDTTLKREDLEQHPPRMHMGIQDRELREHRLEGSQGSLRQEQQEVLESKEEREQVGVLEVGRDLDFSEEPLDAEHGTEFRVQDLEGDFAVMANVARKVDRGHAAPADLAFDGVSAFEGTGEGGLHRRAKLSRGTGKGQLSRDRNHCHPRGAE